MVHINTLQNFTINNLPDLDTAVMGALELFTTNGLPDLKDLSYARPLVVGSGNAEATGRIIFKDTDAVFATESNYEDFLKNIPAIDGVVLISASGGKHAPIIAKKARQYNKPVTLITNTPNSPASQQLDKHISNEFIFPKNREPYTYNTSTYMGMILASTGESPQQIKEFIEQTVDNLELPDFSKYDKYYVIVPPKFSSIVRMIQIKFVELFGRNIARDIETSEQVKHATTVAPSDELFISFGEENTTWGNPKNRLFIPLPKDASYGAIMAVSYYIVAQIQKQQPQYFKENIAAYTAMMSDMFKEDIKPIVEGS